MDTLEKILASLPSAYDGLIFITLAVSLLVIAHEYAPKYSRQTTFYFAAISQSRIGVVPGFQKLSRAIRFFSVGWIAAVLFVLFSLFKDIWLYMLLFLFYWIYLVIPTILASLSVFELVEIKAMLKELEATRQP